MTYIVLALTVGALVFLAYRQGLKDGIRKDKGEVLEPIAPSLPKSKPKQDARLATLLHNINVYDGTAKGQKEVR